MQIASILKTKGATVSTTRADARIAAVAERLRAESVGALVVSEDGQRVDGLITERDIVVGLAEHGVRVLTMRVLDLMQRSPVTCSPDESITSVMGLMTRSRVRHVPVVRDGQLCGIVSLGDVVKHRLDELQAETNVLREQFLARRA